jgi:hypothetical protein
MNLDGSVLDELISEQLAAVTFIHDYIQLQFGSPPTLNAYTVISVHSQGATLRSGNPGFAQALVDQINKRVCEVSREPSQRLEIKFDDGSAIEISLRPDDYRGPEAFEYFGRQGVLLVE